MMSDAMTVIAVNTGFFVGVWYGRRHPPDDRTLVYRIATNGGARIKAIASGMLEDAVEDRAGAAFEIWRVAP